MEGALHPPWSGGPTADLKGSDAGLVSVYSMPQSKTKEIMQHITLLAL